MEKGKQEGRYGLICANYYFSVDGAQCEDMSLRSCPAGYEEYYTPETCPVLKKYINFTGAT